jgi:hypothetical protein
VVQEQRIVKLSIQYTVRIPSLAHPSIGYTHKDPAASRQCNRNSRYTNDSSENERQARIRIYRQLQSPPERLQSQKDRESAFHGIPFTLFLSLSTLTHITITAYTSRKACEMQNAVRFRASLFFVFGSTRSLCLGITWNSFNG